MVRAFERTGGLACCSAVAQLMRGHTDQPVSRIARWVVDRRVVSIEWQATLLLPLFQFEPPTLCCRAGLDAILDEWAGVLDDWHVALWFAEPNVKLDEAAPADRLALDPAGVLQAARHDRFVARW